MGVIVTTISADQVSLEWNYRNAVGGDRDKAFASIRVIGSLAQQGRNDAAVFLMGMLVAMPREDFEQRTRVVKALADLRRGPFAERCSDLLFDELDRVPSSNKSRRYIDTILDVLKRFPAPIVIDRLSALAQDRDYSPKMRSKFKSYLDELTGENPLRTLYDNDDD